MKYLKSHHATSKKHPMNTSKCFAQHSTMERAARPLLRSPPCCSAAQHGRRPEVLRRPTWGSGGRRASSDAPHPAAALAMGERAAPLLASSMAHAASLGFGLGGDPSPVRLGCGRPSGSSTPPAWASDALSGGSTPAGLGAWVARRMRSSSSPPHGAATRAGCAAAHRPADLGGSHWRC
jgi:hypothetical protein